jgi:tRNA threonylcarbamoyl adenosine modification protein (Sua5/YciO/YrdC/YwlC family)
MLGMVLWPGGLTLVVHRNSTLPPQLGQGDTIAVRVPSHDSLRRFIASSGGAVAATSANLSGQPDALEVEQAVSYLGEHVAIYIDGGGSPGGTPSTVVDCTVTPVSILRVGAISPERIEQILGSASGGFS